MAKLSTAQQERESREGRWERYILWYTKVPEDERRHLSDAQTWKKTFYERSQIDDFLADNPRYRAKRIDRTVQTTIWTNEGRS